MKFCPYCGKQLADNEICTCRQQINNGQSQQFNGQAQQFNAQGQQFNGQAQQFNAQGQQFNGQAQQFNAQGQQFNPKGQQYSNQAESEGFKTIEELIKGLFKTPVEAVSKFVKKGNVAASIILIVAFAIIQALAAGVRILDYNITYDSSYYTTSKIFGLIFKNIFDEVLGILIFAAVLMIVVNALEKNKKVAFTQVLAIACICELVCVPVALLGDVIALIPGKFFGYLDTWICSFAGALGLIYTFFAVKSVEENENNMPLTYALATVAASVCSTIVSLIF